MNKHNYFVKFLKKINLSINSLLEKYLNKLNFINLSNIIRSNKVLLSFIALIILFLSYLSIPHIYNKTQIKVELENQLFNKFNLNFNFSKNFNYKFFPRPHFIVEDSFIYENQLKVSEIKKLSVFISLNNLFSLKNIMVKEVVLENANFNFNKKNYDFFIKILDNNFLENTFIIKNSNVFFKSIEEEEEVLFINKIINMKYHYNSKELKNIVSSKNEIFNIPYYFTLYKDEEKIFSKINLNFLKLQIENEFDYNNLKKKGFTNLIFKKNKSISTYELDKNLFVFDYYDKLSNPNFSYKGKINFNPFFLDIKGKTNKLDLSNFFNPNQFFIPLLKTEILNNKNLNIDLNINANQISNYQDFINLFLKYKIEEGLIDIDQTKFSWSDSADFEITDSLLYVNQNHLILDGKLLIKVKDYNKIYKFLQISKNLRPELEKIEFNFNYNFDEKIITPNNIKINNENSKKVNDILKKILFKDDKLQNKIYIKNLMKKAIIAYVG